MMVILISKYEPIEGNGKYHLVEGSGKYYLANSQNVREDLKSAIASYQKARKWRRREPYKGKGTKKGKRRRKGKDYEETGIVKGKDYEEEGLRRRKGKDYQAESWLNECSLKEQGDRKEFKVPGCGGWASLVCVGGCLSIHEVFLVVPVLVLTTD